MNEVLSSDLYALDEIFTLRNDGFLVRKKHTSFHGARAGDVVKYVNPEGYIELSAMGKQYKAHRICWLLMFGHWPHGLIDHIDGDKTNNRRENLRDVSNQINQQNRGRLPSSNTSGILGVSWSKRDNLWRARGKDPVTLRQVSLGCFKDKYAAGEAALAYRRNAYAGHITGNEKNYSKASTDSKNQSHS